MDSETRQKVEEVVRRFARKDKRDMPLTDETSLHEGLEVDSASRVDIVLELEDAFGISITDTEADHLQRYGEVVALVEAKLATARA